MPTDMTTRSIAVARRMPDRAVRPHVDELRPVQRVLEHVDRPEVLLRHPTTHLADAAILVIRVPGGPRTAFDRQIGHRCHVTTRSIEAVITDAGLEPIRVPGAGFPGRATLPSEPSTGCSAPT